METCEHFEGGSPPDAKSQGCEECVATSGEWVHLRICRSCGHVGCRDSSPGRHATAHFHETQHPVMQSWEPGETWGWCYVDAAQVGPFPAAR